MKKNVTDFLHANKLPLVLLSAIILTVAYIITITAYTGNLSRKKSSLTLQLEEINSLSSGLAETRKIVEKSEKKLNTRNSKGVVTTLDELLASLNLKAEKLKPSDKKRVNEYTEENADMEISGIDLNEVVNLLYRINSSPAPMKIKSISMQTSFENSDLFILNLSVSLLSRS